MAKVAKKKNPAAVALGKARARQAGPDGMRALAALGATKGGHARAAALSAKQRKEIAKKASAARWGKKRK